MGARGPAPTPTKVLQLRGTFRPDRHGGSEPQPTTLSKVPRPPSHFGKTEKRIWRYVCNLLITEDRLAASDLGALEGYVTVWARALDAEAVVAVEGRTFKGSQGLQRHPELITAERARADMRRYEQLFGLTPSDRARMRVPTRVKKEPSPWDKVANG
jgi:P27 family predicted phage terminase small subunit